MNQLRPVMAEHVLGVERPVGASLARPVHLHLEYGAGRFPPLRSAGDRGPAP